MRTFVVRTPYVINVYEKIICVLTVYDLKSSIAHNKTGMVCIAFPRIYRKGHIGEIWCFSKILGIPGKSPKNPRKTSRENPGFFRVLRL
jgi:hypothetical protein